MNDFETQLLDEEAAGWKARQGGGNWWENPVVTLAGPQGDVWRVGTNDVYGSQCFIIINGGTDIYTAGNYMSKYNFDGSSVAFQYEVAQVARFVWPMWGTEFIFQSGSGNDIWKDTGSALQGFRRDYYGLGYHAGQCLGGIVAGGNGTVLKWYVGDVYHSLGGYANIGSASRAGVQLGSPTRFFILGQHSTVERFIFALDVSSGTEVHRTGDLVDLINYKGACYNNGVIYGFTGYNREKVWKIPYDDVSGFGTFTSVATGNSSPNYKVPYCVSIGNYIIAIIPYTNLLQIYDTETLALVADLSGGDTYYDLKIFPDGEHFALACGSAGLKIYKVQ